MAQDLIDIHEATSEKDFLDAKKLILEYVNWLSQIGGSEIVRTLSSQNLDKEMDSLSTAYSETEGALFIAIKDGQAVAIAGIKRFSDSECELKRMYVQKNSRGLGIGRALLLKCIEKAKGLHYKSIKLDTLDFMHSALKLYFETGFVEVSAYRLNTHKDVRFFDLDLKKLNE